MREILFRGKRKDGGEWVEGFFILAEDVCKPDNAITPFIFETDLIHYGCGEFNSAIEVIPETVRQYTGLTDKNGTKIFEGDILNNSWCFALGNSVVKFGTYKPLDMTGKYQQGHLGFHLEHIHRVDKRSMRSDLMFFANKCEIIGNIHDNPELLKEGADNGKYQNHNSH